MLVLKKDFNFDAFEAALRKVSASRELRLPSQMKHVGLWGVEVALIQLLVTWIRSNQHTSVKTYINDTDSASSRQTQLHGYGQRLYGIAAMYLAEGLTTGQGTTIERAEYVRECAEVLRSMDRCNIYDPVSVNRTYPRQRDRVAAQFLCLHGSAYEFQGALYNARSREGSIGRVEFETMIISALRNKRVFWDYLKDVPGFVISLASLVYELFQNTNDHAYDDIDGLSFTKNVRAITISSHSDMLDRKDLEGMLSVNDQFNAYLEYCTKRFGDLGSGMHRFLEISVVDGGPGLVPRYSGKHLSELSVEEEAHLAARCFEAGVSSKDTQSRGEGLDNVWKALCRLDGFIRIRTGRVCIFQTFNNKTDSDPREFSNWSNAKLGPAAGTAVTIIVPCFF